MSALPATFQLKRPRVSSIVEMLFGFRTLAFSASTLISDFVCLHYKMSDGHLLFLSLIEYARVMQAFRLSWVKYLSFGSLIEQHKEPLKCTQNVAVFLLL